MRAATLTLVLLASPSGCDGGGAAGDDAADACAETETACEPCLVCAATDPCAEILGACRDDAECTAFQACLPETDDEARFAQCREDHPDGAEMYCAGTRCTVYDECDALCEDSRVCPQF